MPTSSSNTGHDYQKIRAFLPSFILAVLLCIAFSIPGDFIVETKSRHVILELIFSDVLFHFLSFALFAWLLSSGFYWLLRRRIPLFKIIGISCGYGILVEIWQIVLPYRGFDFRDIGMDFLGTTTAVLVFLLVPGVRKCSLKFMTRLNPKH